jgi:hypothetical protein
MMVLSAFRPFCQISLSPDLSFGPLLSKIQELMSATGAMGFEELALELGLVEQTKKKEKPRISSTQKESIEWIYLSWRNI